jgi:hypothetical protein
MSFSVTYIVFQYRSCSVKHTIVTYIVFQYRSCSVKHTIVTYIVFQFRSCSVKHTIVTYIVFQFKSCSFKHTIVTYIVFQFRSCTVKHMNAINKIKIFFLIKTKWPWTNFIWQVQLLYLCLFFFYLQIFANNSVLIYDVCNNCMLDCTGSELKYNVCDNCMLEWTGFELILILLIAFIYNWKIYKNLN